ncbi:MAG: LysM peptidoglycan-binding domain-containing protein [Chloroflexi bacterium]|nr:LysM peptidoglycan-binding domain-containing protein [Chloroflexota bacterium]
MTATSSSKLVILLTIAGLVLAIFSLSAPMVTAQDGNLLADAGFEGAYVGRGRPDLNTAAPWLLFNADSPRNYEWQNRSDKVYAFPPSRRGGEVHSGTLSQNINGGYVTFTVAVYQTVSVPANTSLNANIWARIKTCNIGQGADNCGSAVESGAYVKVGVDPSGGTNPFSPSVVWSSNIAPHDTWQQVGVTVTTTGPTATFFAFFTQNSPSQLNNVWFDDAYLGTGSSGGSVAPGQPAPSTAVPTQRPAPTAFIAFRQPLRPDGSQHHVIITGDTLTGIATAYSVTVERIMELNNLRSSRFIFPGQDLLIIPAGEGGGSGTGAGTGTGTPQPTRRPTLPPLPTLSAADMTWLAGGAGGPTPVGMGD